MSNPDNNRSLSKFVWASALVIVLGLMIAPAYHPNWNGSRTMSRSAKCRGNLRQIEGAKEQWALEKRKSADAVPQWKDLLPYMGEEPVCPSGGTYSPNSIEAAATCSFTGRNPESHALP